MQCIVEQRISDCTARNNRPAVCIPVEGMTIGQLVGGFKDAQQLIIVARLNISSMILIEVRQAIVEENVAREHLVEIEGDLTGAFKVGIMYRSSKLISASVVKLSSICRVPLFAVCIVDDMLGNLDESKTKKKMFESFTTNSIVDLSR